MVFAHNVQLGKQAFNKIFHLIRTSDVATKLGITSDTILTLGLYDQWHHVLYTTAMVQINEAAYGQIHPSSYMLQAAKTILMENNSQKVSLLKYSYNEYLYGLLFK